MRKCLLAFFSGIFMMPVFSQTNFTGELTDADPTFNRPDKGQPPTALSITGTNVHYDILPLNIPTPGLVTVSTNSIWDNFIILYDQNGFNPAMPLDNALLAEDDLNGPNAGFTYNFTTAGNYSLVICSYKNDVTGAYNVATTAPAPLPLRLISFTALKTTHNTNTLNWSSADESNLISYQVQRSSSQGNFKDLANGTIAAKNSASNAAYIFVDKNPVAGNNYYRLKISERSGGVAYSPVALVRNASFGISNLHVFPNPSTDYIKIDLNSVQNVEAMVSVISTGGATVLKGQQHVDDQSVLTIDIKRLPAGKYFVQTMIGKNQTTTSFIKN